MFRVKLTLSNQSTIQPSRLSSSN